MKYVNFGNAGVKVSQIALGLGLRGQKSAQEAQKLIEHAIESGINLIDCANVYGLGDDRRYVGTSEQILSHVLKKKRNSVVITSKVSSPMGDAPNDSGSSRYHIIKQVEDSLRRLETNHIDIYLLHGWDIDTPIDETVRALDDLITQGKVLYVGACNFAAWQICKMLGNQEKVGADRLITIQNQYSLLKRDPEQDLFPVVRDQGIGMMAYSPLAIGLLTEAHGTDGKVPRGSMWRRTERIAKVKDLMTPEIVALIEAVRKIASERAKTMAQVAVNWVLSHPEITIAISGSDTVEQLDDNLGALGWDLSAEELDLLDNLSNKSFGQL